MHILSDRITEALRFATKTSAANMGRGILID